ncbi:Uncharacterized protein SCG7086_BZ_00060 [Chlamydiales bacterium SCGC AG-110-P3]|nr:Uncharacterized protein SCG7086_BZ_00060 [Chlamydiales bacterium SCGC AG-110-P3]
MRKYFLTGLAILLPLALTIAIVTFLVNLLTAPFIGIVKPLLARYDLFQNGVLVLSGEQLLQYGSQAAILIFLFCLTVMLGALTRWFVVHYFIGLGDYILHRIPLVNTVYKTSQDVIKTIFTGGTKSFKQVALVPFPHRSTRSIGLVTREEVTGSNGEKLVAVFVPTTPNPTSGFLMLFKREDTVFLDMAVEDAFKYIISCGVIATPFHPIDGEEGTVAVSSDAVSK